MLGWHGTPEHAHIEIVDNSYVAGAALGPRDLSLQVGHAGVDGESQEFAIGSDQAMQLAELN